jgi:hypothetical protein
MTKKTKESVQMIVVDADGTIITAANGLVSSDNPELVKAVKRAVSFRRRIQIVQPSGSEIRANLDPKDLIGITAALFSAKPGRTRLLEAPAEVKEWFKLERADFGGGCLPLTSYPEDSKATDAEAFKLKAIQSLDPMTIAREMFEEDE